jgi:polar amino acid transport system substrate-binding protein
MRFTWLSWPFFEIRLMRRLWKKWLLGVSAVACGLLALTAWVHAGDRAPAPHEIVLVSEQWNAYTEADGSGLGWDLMREVFEPAGVKVQSRIEPYMRAVGLVQRGEADAWVGAYEGEVEGTLYPKWNYDVDEIYAVGMATSPVPTLETLGNYRLAWVRGYDFQQYLPHITHFNEVVRRDNILSMLTRERADYYIDAKPEVGYILGQSSEPDHFRATHITDIPLYLSFSNTDRGRALRDLFDQRMAQLVHSGKLKPIFAHWKQPYPFEAGDSQSKPKAKH